MKLFEIQNIVKELDIPNFKGIFLRDELSKHNTLVGDIECGIIHSHTSKEDIEKVGHWTAYYKDHDKKYYFCPFGGEVYDEIKKYLGFPIMTHTFQIQEFNETCCAEYCILFIYFMYKKFKYEDIILFLVKE